MTTTATEREIPLGDYRCICGITLALRHRTTRLDCSCGRSYDYATAGDPPRNDLLCATCGATSTSSGRGSCPVCGAARRPMVDPLGGEGQAPAGEQAPAARVRAIDPSDAYRSVCGAQIHVLARTDRATCDGCGRTYVGADAIGDPRWGAYTCSGCGSGVDPDGKRPCPICQTPRQSAVDPWPDGVQPARCAREGCTAEVDPDESGYCSAAHWVADFDVRRAAWRGETPEHTTEGE